MTLTEGERRYAEAHGADESERDRLREAYRAGYLQAVDNWMTKARR